MGCSEPAKKKDHNNNNNNNNKAGGRGGLPFPGLPVLPNAKI